MIFMRRFFSLFWGVLALGMMPVILTAQEGRRPWQEVPLPRIVSVNPDQGDPSRLILSFEADLSAQGADRAVISLMDEKGKVLESRTMGRTSRPIKQADFRPGKTARYQFQVALYRNGETEARLSSLFSYDFRLPLAMPELQLLNKGKGTLLVRWASVPEAETYEVRYVELPNKNVVPSLTDASVYQKKSVIQKEGNNLECLLEGLSVGKPYAISLAVFRGPDVAVSAPVVKTIRDVEEREWRFTWFGQSSREDLNTFKMLDNDNFVFQLTSCQYDPKTGETLQKGGKFTAFHDGISFYYTVLDPRRENFELSATFQVDYINPTADGQEGFGLLVLDSLGQHGVNNVNHYTNSAGILATKFEETIDGVKRTSKDTLGARFVTGLSKEVIASGDSGIAQKGVSVGRAFSYDSSALIRRGDIYRITLKKTNTGYHAIYQKPYATEEDRTEFILYGPEKLQVLDPDHIYVGFAVARGCNVTVRDVEFRVTDAQKDPPGVPEPPEVVPLIAKVDSPTTYTSESYPLVFYANAAGRLTVQDTAGKVLVRDVPIKPLVDYTTTLRLKGGSNDFVLQFTPDPSYKPGPKQVIGRYDSEQRAYVENYSPYYINLSVLYNKYEGKDLYVSPEGSPFGKGTTTDPLDLTTALYFVGPGQRIILKGGVYYPSRTVTIERGNNGTEKQRKVLISAPGERAILDFSASRAKTAGFILWGNYWTIESIDIRSTPGDVKGLQVGGNYNIIRDVRTYRCGDTGLQISGVSAEPREKWPRYNQVINCLSHDNQDPASNNADGFAAKLTVGEGNRFYGCIAHHNIDDGWDLFSKIESGPIGSVLVENCVAYNNGFLSDGSGNGDGNGFKMGGDGIAVSHVLKNSIAFGNGTSGITSNSNPALIIENCTSYGNKGANINLYGKGDGKRLFVVRNVLSFGGGSGDVYREMPELAAPHNFFWNGAACVNSEGRTLGKDAFVSVDMTTLPRWDAKGNIDLQGFLVPTAIVPQGVGARF